MVDETQSNSGKKASKPMYGKLEKIIISGLTMVVMGMGGYLYGTYADAIKKIAIRDVNNDYKEDIIITHNNGIKEAFINQSDNSYISWYEVRRNLYKTVDDVVNQVESEIKK